MNPSLWNPYLEGLTLFLLLALLISFFLPMPPHSRKHREPQGKISKNTKKGLEPSLFSPEVMAKKMENHPSLAGFLVLTQFVLPLILALIFWMDLLWNWAKNQARPSTGKGESQEFLQPKWNLLDIFRVVLLFIVLQMDFQWIFSYYEWEIPSIYVHLGATNLIGLLCLGFIFCVWKIRKVRWASFFEKPRSKDLLWAFKVYFLITPFLLLAAFISQVLGKWWKIPFETHPVVNMVYSGDALLVYVLCFFAILWAPLVEEVFFRAFLYPPLRHKLGKVGAMVAVSLLFTILHPGFHSLLPIFVLAMTLVYIYEKTQNLWPCIFLHFLNNGFTMAKVLMIKELLH